MAKTLQEIRASLAQETGLFLGGTATGGSASTIIDTNGLKRFTETDALEHATAYIRTAGAASPEGESKFVTGYNGTNQTVTLESNLGAAVESGDVYEIYRAPLTIAQWDECINRAIREAWPEIWERNVATPMIGSDVLVLPGNTEGVEAVEVRMITELAGYPREPIPPSLYHLEWDSVSSLWLLHLHRKPPAANRLLTVRCKERYVELADDDTTTLDTAYLMAAAKSYLYEALAGETGGQTDAARYLQLLNFWREQAQFRKAELNALLMGLPAPTKKGK